MNCHDVKEKILDMVLGELDKKTCDEFHEHIKTCIACTEELNEINASWAQLGTLPEEQPSDAVRTRFYAMLESYKQDVKQKKTISAEPGYFKRLFRFIPLQQPINQWTMTLLILVIGILLGYLLHSSGNGSAELTSLHQELHQMRQMVAVSLLTQNSSSERIRGVSLSSKIENPDSEMLHALFDTLNTDLSVSVRLAAIKSLAHFYEMPAVRNQLIQTIPQQTSPLVQMALITLMDEMNDRQALLSLEQLMKENNLHPDVKKQTEQCIQKLKRTSV